MSVTCIPTKIVCTCDFCGAKDDPPNPRYRQYGKISYSVEPEWGAKELDLCDDCYLAVQTAIAEVRKARKANPA